MGAPPQAILRKTQTRVPTAAALLTSNSGSNNGSPSCVYCGQGHTSTSCATVTDVAARKDVLRKTGRCYVCLRKNHLSRDCRSSSTCRVCRRRHHVSICPRRNADQGRSASGRQGSSDTNTTGTPIEVSPQTSTNTMYVGTQTPILLQTAKVQLINPRPRRPASCLEQSWIVVVNRHT